MDDRGDLITTYDTLAAKEDSRRRRLNNDTRVAAGMSLGDLVPGALRRTAGMNETLAERTGGEGMNFDLASAHLAQRARFLGIADPQHLIAKARKNVFANMNLCESPIEKRILPWLVCEDYGRDILTSPVPVCNVKADELPPKGDIFIVPQMAFVKFRIDFAIIRRFVNGHLGIVALECDGSDYHSAVRDTLRNGWLASFQIKTIRASGSTIHQRPREVSARVAEAVMELGA